MKKLYGDIVLLGEGLNWVRDIGQRVDYESVTGIYREGREDDYSGVHGYVAYDQANILPEKPMGEELELYKKIIKVQQEKQQLLNKYLTGETGREDYENKSKELNDLEETHRKLTSEVYNKVVTHLESTLGNSLTYLYMSYDPTTLSVNILVKYTISEEDLKQVSKSELGGKHIKLLLGQTLGEDGNRCRVHQILQVDMGMSVDDVASELQTLRGVILE